MDSAARWTARLEIIAPLTLFACGLWVFVFTPTETEQGFVQKIMYIHVPSVIVTYLAFFVTFAFGIAYLWKRLLVFDRIAKVSAEIGLIFCAMVLLSAQQAKESLNLIKSDRENASIPPTCSLSSICHSWVKTHGFSSISIRKKYDC